MGGASPGGWRGRSRKAWGTWGQARRGRELQLEQPHSAHKHGPPQSLEQGKEASTSLPSLESPLLAWTRLWSGLGPLAIPAMWSCPGSPWLLGTFNMFFVSLAKAEDPF